MQPCPNIPHQSAKPSDWKLSEPHFEREIMYNCIYKDYPSLSNFHTPTFSVSSIHSIASIHHVGYKENQTNNSAGRFLRQNIYILEREGEQVR